MPFIRVALIFLSLSIAACAGHEGLYEPACIAYEGDRIELKDGRFEWRRFTDQRVVGDDGNIVDPFPGFPRTGAYRRSSGRLEFSSDDGMKLDDWFIVEHEARLFLLSGNQHDAFLESNTVPECALRQRDAGS